MHLTYTSACLPSLQNPAHLSLSLSLSLFSAPTSPVHYILRSSPSSTANGATPDGDSYGATASTAGDFEFAARAGGMSSSEELFVVGRIRVGCLSPICQETGWDDDGDVEGEERDSRGLRTHRARSTSPPLSPRATRCAELSDPSASALSSSSSSSSTSSSSSGKNTSRRISLRDLLTRTGCDCVVEQAADTAGAETRSGFWAPSIWTSRSKKALPCPAPQLGCRSTSSDMVVPTKWASGSGTATLRKEARRRTTFLSCQQGLILGCLGFGARSYGLAKSMHPLYSR